MGSSVDGEFTRSKIEMGSSEDGSFTRWEFRRSGVYEKRSSGMES